MTNSARGPYSRYGEAARDRLSRLEPEPDAIVTGAVLRAARIAQGHTQEECAVALDATRGTLAAWETGRRAIPRVRSWYRHGNANARALAILAYVKAGRKAAGIEDAPPAPKKAAAVAPKKRKPVAPK